MNVTGGTTDVTTYFALRLAATGAEATALDVTTFDLQYVRTGAAPAAKVDATALAATDSAHADNKAIEIDATDQPGLYRVDWPDAAFAAGVREAIMTVKCATCFTEHLRVAIDAPVSLPSTYDFAKGTVAMTESYAANGAAPTPVQALHAIHQMLMQFAISGTSYTVKKLDNSTTAFIVTLDHATLPTSTART